MLRLDKVIKPWKESAALNAHLSLYGFWNETTFLTKSGDVGMVLSIPGVDYESLDRSEQEYAVKRLETALKAFGAGVHVYQYLFKSNRPDMRGITTALEQEQQFDLRRLHHPPRDIERSASPRTYADSGACAAASNVGGKRIEPCLIEGKPLGCARLPRAPLDQDGGAATTGS